MDLNTVRRIAERRFGLITRAELHRCGISDRQIARLVRTGALTRLHRGVYRLPASDPSVAQQALAACLAIGDHAFASHLTAAAAWGIGHGGGKPEVTIPWDRRCRQTTIVVHRSLFLDRNHVTRIGVIPITRIPRTLSDLASRVQTDDLEEMLDEALRRRLATPEQLAVYPRLRRLAQDRLGGVPGSRLERLAIAALKRAGLPDPVRQHAAGRYRIDLAYPEHHIAIELEGRAPHWGHERWESDHHRRRALELVGWRVLPFTWRDVTTGTFAIDVGAALGLRPTRWSAR